MGALTDLRLFRRRALLLWLALTPALIIWVLGIDSALRGHAHLLARIGYWQVQYLAPDQVHILHLAGLMLTGFLGFLVGQNLLEWQHCYLAGTLPGLRRRLALLTLGIGLGWAAAGAVIYRVLGGPMALPAAAGFFLFWFVMGLVSERNTGFRPGWMILAAVDLAALVFVDDLTRLFIVHPWPAGILALAGAAGLLAHRFSREHQRGLPFRTVRSLLEGKEGGGLWSIKSGLFGIPRASRRVWSGALAGADDLAWSKAAQYELTGGLWTWAFRRVLLFGAAALGLTLAMSLLDATGGPEPVRNGVRLAVAAVFETPGRWTGSERPAFWGVNWILTYVLFMYVLSGAHVPRKGWLYPLSRERISRIVWKTSLVHALIATVTLGAVFVAGCAALCLAFGLPLPLHGTPGFLRALGLGIALLPLAQWIRIRHRIDDLWCGARRFDPLAVLIGIVYPVGVSLAATWWDRAAGVVPGALLAVLVALLFLAVQALYRQRLGVHFRRADLV